MDDSEKNRRLRLEQVRKQSKEIALNLREKVTSEKQKQEERIEALKRQEKIEWQRKSLQHKGKQYTKCLSRVGEAHLAAAKEALLPAVPSSSTMRGYRKPPEQKKSPVKKSTTLGVNERKSTTKAIQTSPPQEENAPIFLGDSESDSSTLVDSDILISSSDSVLEVPSTGNKAIEGYILKEKISFENISPDKNYFSQVSSLIQRKFSVNDENPKQYLSRKYYENKPSSQLYKALQEQHIPKASNGDFHPKECLNSVRKDTITSGNAKRLKVSENPRPLPSNKVHYYDHKNRFHKNYIPPANTVIKMGSSDQQDAYRNAREEEDKMRYSEKLKDIERIEKRRLENLRGKQALEKERLRRNYEELLLRVDELLDHGDQDEALKTESSRIKGQTLNIADDVIIESGLKNSNGKENDIDHLIRPENEENLTEILKKILRKLDDNKVQIVEEILNRGVQGKDAKSETCEAIEGEKNVIRKSKDNEDQLEQIPEKQSTDPTDDAIEIKTRGRNDRVEVMSLVQNDNTQDKNSKKKPQIQIVINVKDNPQKHKDDPHLNNLSKINQESSKISNSEHKNQKMVFHKDLSDVMGKRYPKTPEKRDKISIDTVSSITSESSACTTYHSPPLTLPNDLFQHLQKLKENVKQPKEDKIVKTDRKTVLLKKYINRLLDMPRSEVDLLSVSSGTEIPTPNASVIDVPTNFDPQGDLQSVKINARDKKKKKLIKYQLIRERDKAQEEQEVISKKSSKKTSKSERDDFKKIREVPTSPIMSSRQRKITPLEQSHTMPAESDSLREKYVDCTERYMARIQKLSKLINQVRCEKNRLIKDNVVVSSGSDNGLDTSTKYKDFPNGQANADSTTDMSNVSEMKSSKDEDQHLSVNLDKSNLTTCKTIGVSKDSGISISRPVTSTEVRDSPEIRLRTDKDSSDNKKSHSSMNTFKPSNTSHELSTIAEMDTSRVHASSMVSNMSKIEEAFKDLKDAIEKISNDIEYEKFPSFDNYVKKLAKNFHNRVDTTNGDKSELNKNILEMFKDLSQDMMYQNFPTYQEFLRQEKGSIVAEGGSTTELDVASENGVSEFSLPDVVAELIQRNVMDQPFKNTPDNTLDEDIKEEKKTDNEEKGKSRATGAIRKQSVGLDLPKSSSSSSINLEADFRKVGLRWASSMLEKTREHQLFSSSDSSTQLNTFDPRFKPLMLNLTGGENSEKVRNSDTSTIHDSNTGKPINLLEFLNRELQRKAPQDVSQSGGDESAERSRFLSKENLIHRTSTPVTGGKTVKSIDKKSRNSSSVITISTESRLSSIDSVKE